jgi:hypothetical protein
VSPGGHAGLSLLGRKGFVSAAAGGGATPRRQPEEARKIGSLIQYHHPCLGFPFHCVDNHPLSFTHNIYKMVSSDRWRGGGLRDHIAQECPRNL